MTRSTAVFAGLVLAGASALVLPASASAAVLPSNCVVVPEGGAVECTFHSTGQAQAFAVPAGVNLVEIVAVGGRGGSSLQGSGQAVSGNGGAGAKVAGPLTVTPESELVVMVGGVGGVPDAGWNGGGKGGTCEFTGCEPFGSDVQSGGGGGGASDVRTGSGLETRVLVAAGGGGGGNFRDGGAAGTVGGGGAGGGAGGADAGGQAGGEDWIAESGVVGVGGVGVSNVVTGTPHGGGGGGGLFGGGGGGGGNEAEGGYFGGGGGGSSLAPAGGTVTIAATGDAPMIMIRYSSDDPAPETCTGSLCGIFGSLGSLFGSA